ncbi:hypothetical protein XhyaCFBP1156_10180 [Xanthomonas hyacinthi]|uniref:Uncharacterized protein n=1 Tax=Xanthomonas hyacinthi TaxID=56455 RepID=A0A2S7EX72_9XANT|nr:hypothetical protein XhyaCFBP1156_10180 [Xanthomonas hyacinthi]
MCRVAPFQLPAYRNQASHTVLVTDDRTQPLGQHRQALWRQPGEPVRRMRTQYDFTTCLEQRIARVRILARFGQAADQHRQVASIVAGQSTLSIGTSAYFPAHCNQPGPAIVLVERFGQAMNHHR